MRRGGAVMTMTSLLGFLGWCTVINVGILILWFLCFALGHDAFFRYHSKLFKITAQQFDAIHYALMGYYKFLILVFNAVPYLVLRLAV